MHYRSDRDLLPHPRRIVRPDHLPSVGLLGLVAVFLMGPAPLKVVALVEAQRFVLRDVGGAARAELAVGGDGSLGLSRHDKTGTRRAEVSLRPDGSPGLALFDAHAQVRVALGLLDSGAPALNLTDGEGFAPRSGCSRTGDPSSAWRLPAELCAPN